MVKKVGLASCDWKHPEALISDLTKILPQLGIHAYDVNTGGDSFHIAVSSTPLTEKELESLECDGVDSEVLNLEP